VKIVIFTTVRPGKAPEAGMSKGQTNPKKNKKKRNKNKREGSVQNVKGQEYGKESHG